MIEKPLEKEMARCNRNLLLANAFITAFILFCAFVSQKYWFNFAFGPFPTDVETLFATSNPAELTKQFVVLKGEKTLPTKLQSIEQTVNKKTNEITDEKVKGYYLILRSHDKGVIVRSPINTTATSFEGKLESVPALANQYLVQPLAPDVQKRVSPLMLDVVGYRQSGFIAIFLGVPLLGIALWNLRKLGMRKGDVSKHPIMVALSKHGDPRQLAPQLEEEMRSPFRKQLGGNFILDNWVIGRFPFTLSITRMEDLAWIHRKETRHSVNFIPTGTTFELVLHTKDGKMNNLTGTKAQVDESIGLISARVPWIYSGYSDELNAHWTKNRAAMLAAIEEAKQKASA